MLSVEQKETKKPQSFTLKPSTVAQLKRLAKVYDTNSSQMVETLITHYAPKLLAMEEERKASGKRRKA